MQQRKPLDVLSCTSCFPYHTMLGTLGLAAPPFFFEKKRRTTHSGADMAEGVCIVFSLPRRREAYSLECMLVFYVLFSLLPDGGKRILWDACCAPCSACCTTARRLRPRGLSLLTYSTRYSRLNMEPTIIKCYTCRALIEP